MGARRECVWGGWFPPPVRCQRETEDVLSEAGKNEVNGAKNGERYDIFGHFGIIVAPHQIQ